MTFTESIGIGIGAGLGFVAIVGAFGILAAWRVHLWTKKLWAQGAPFMEKALPILAQMQGGRMPPFPPVITYCSAGCMCEACYGCRRAGLQECHVCHHTLGAVMGG